MGRSISLKKVFIIYKNYSKKKKRFSELHINCKIAFWNRGYIGRYY